MQNIYIKLDKREDDLKYCQTKVSQTALKTLVLQAPAV